jgi:hypothetical protein
VNPLHELEKAMAMVFAADPGWWWMLCLIPMAALVAAIIVENFWNDK